MKVLFVDDEPEFLDMLLEQMKKRNVYAIGVPDGDQAIGLVEQNPYDIVVLNVKPAGGRSGIDVLKEIKNIKPLVEVIMLTDHTVLDAAKESIENGAFDYMLKSSDTDELFFKICDAFKKKTIQEAKLSCTDKSLRISKI